MRRRIYNLANGIFESESPNLTFSEERLELQITEGKNYKGSFTMRSENGIPLRGVIYTSNVRMECLNPQFEGSEVQIQYEFHSNGLVEGDIQQGEFYIICSQNEYNLSFVVDILGLYPDSSQGKIRSLYDFTKLASANRQEAYEIFTSPLFSHLFKKEEKKERMLYEGLAKAPVTMQNLEEFLIGIRQKSRVELSLGERETGYENITETFKECVHLVRNQWGYLEISVTSDAEFLKPLKEKMTTDDFVGSSVKLEYLIEVEKLHSGRNYGKIWVSTPYQKIDYTVCVHQHTVREGRKTEQKKKKAEFARLYTEFRLQKIPPGVWSGQAVGILEELMAQEPKEHWYGLMKAQALLINRQRQEAEWILEEKKKEITDKNSAQWAYYLYLTTLVIREDSYADRILKNVEEICRRDPKDQALIWILLFLRRDYAKNSYGKYQALREQITGGCSSPYFYVEACLLLMKEPYILTELGEFEIRLLVWAMRKGALNLEIARQVMELAGDCRVFEERVYAILQECYRICPTEDMLTVVCAYLIKGQKYKVAFHHWYEEGIACDLRLAGLYEAYVYSMDRRELSQVPKMVQMYFRYHSSLPYEKKAALYVNIIANRESQPAVYASYERTMESFAIEQILEHHMDDNLAVIYDRFLRESMIQKEMAQALGDLLFYHKLTCFDTNMVRVYIVHRQLREGMSVPLVNGTAYFPIYSSEYMIFLEDRFGNRYASAMDYQLEKLMRAGRYVRTCMKYVKDCRSFLIYQLDQNPSLEEFGEQELEVLREFLKSDQISETYRFDLFPQVIRLHQKYQIPFEAKEFLMKINPSMLDPDARRRLIELFVDKQDYGLAYQWMQMYGIEQIGRTEIVEVAAHMAKKEDYSEEEFLVYLCSAAFAAGKYDESVLTCLCGNYDGPTKVLGELWSAAREVGLDTCDLEERTLTQMLYSTDYVPQTEDIFDHYYRNGGKDVIKNAYLNYFSHAYFMENTVLSERFMSYLLTREAAGEEQNDICRLALLKYLSGNKEEQSRWESMIDSLLSSFIEKEMYFECYKGFSQKLQVRYGFYDKTFLEYHSQSGKKVWIHYRMEEEQDYVQKEMREVFPGVFVHGFCIFAGERIQYYISREEEPEPVILESNRLVGSDVYGEEDRSRYVLLNHMLTSLILDQTEKAEEYMSEYEEKERLAGEIFQIL